MLDITVEISTKNRYEYLAHAIHSIAHQIYKPKYLIIYDDSDNPVDLRQHNLFFNLFRILEINNIQWQIIISPKKGQVFNHNTTLNISKTDWIWRLDDDNIAAPDCLQKLVYTAITNSKVGGVAGCVLHPGVTFDSKSTSPFIADSHFKYATQFSKFSGVKEVEHFYSTFLFNRKASPNGYCLELSKVGHREETIFSYEIHRNGYKLFVNGDALTWHFQVPTGGIRSFSDGSLWAKDEQIYQSKLKEWGVILNKYKLFYLNNGIGDHYAFRHILPQIKEKYKDCKIIVSACYEEAFFDEDGIEVINLRNGEILSKGQFEKDNIYKFCYDKKWNRHITTAFKELFL